MVLSIHPARGITWDGGSKRTDNWIDGNGANSGERNWMQSSSPAAGDALVFGGSTRLTPNNNTPADTNYAGITFDSTAGAFLLGGNRITLGGNVTNNDADLQTINMDLILSATRTFSAASGDLAVGGVISGTGGLAKTGDNALTLSGQNSYFGVTSVDAGTLSVNGNQLSATGAVNVASGAKLYGNGILGGATTIVGTHSSGAAAGAVGTTQTFSSSLVYSPGSIFEWDLDVTSSTTEIHDKIVANSLAGSGAVFKILLASGDSFADAFWDTSRNWLASDLFGINNATANLAAIFSSAATTAHFNANPVQGSFSFTSTGGGTGNQLTWTAVPEPTSALVGMLLGAGLLRRRRARSSSASNRSIGNIRI